MVALSPATESAILDAVRRGVPLNTAARAAGVSPETVRRWKLIAESDATAWPNGVPIADGTKEAILRFVQALARAQEQCRETLINSLYTCAVVPNEKTGLPDWRAADALLSKHPAYRAEWREERQVTVQSDSTIRVEHQLVRQLDDAQLQALEQQLAALPAAADE
jgi:hypothetical protein